MKWRNCRLSSKTPDYQLGWAVLAASRLLDTLKLEIVMNELRKNQNFHFDLQIHPTLLNSTYLHCQMTGFISIRVQKF